MTIVRTLTLDIEPTPAEQQMHALVAHAETHLQVHDEASCHAAESTYNQARDCEKWYRQNQNTTLEPWKKWKKKLKIQLLGYLYK